MYVILTYDVQSKRVAKVSKICQKYLNHTQRSVFEGSITEMKLSNLKREIGTVVNPQFDSVIIYHLDSVKYAKKEQIGMVQSISNII